MIIAVKKKGGYLIASKPYLYTTYSDNRVLLPNNFNIFNCVDDKDAIIAVNNDVRIANILKVTEGLLPKSMRKFTFDYFFTEFIHKAYIELSKYNVNDGKGYPTFESDIMVAKKDKLYCVQENKECFQIGNEYFVGKEEDYAIGVLNLNKDKDPMVRVCETIKNLSEHIICTPCEMIVADTSKSPCEIKYYSKEEIEKILS